MAITIGFGYDEPPEFHYPIYEETALDRECQMRLSVRQCISHYLSDYDWENCIMNVNCTCERIEEPPLYE